MPQIPLFVSSSQAGAVQTGSFDVRFQPPLRIPEEGKNATVHIAHATIPYTEPNVSAALGNNTLIVALGLTVDPHENHLVIFFVDEI